MKLYSLNIKNFRGIGNLKIEDFKNINLFVGRNNCGKSSILEAIFLSIGISNPQLVLTIDGFRALIHNEEDDFRLIFYKLDYNNTIIIETDFINKVQYRKLTIKPNLTASNQIHSDKNGRVSTSTAIQENNKIDSLSLEFSIKNVATANPKQYQSLITFKKGAFITTPSKDYHEELSGVYLSPQTLPLDISDRINKIIVNKDESKLINALQRIDSNIKGIVFGSNNLILIDIGIPRRIPLNIMGDGIHRLVSIISTIATSSNGIVIIDEIETGFHHSSLEILWDAIVQATRTYNVQLFASTHSYECVDAFTKQSTNLFSESDDYIRLFRIEKTDDVFSYKKFDKKLIDASTKNNLEIR